MQLGWLAPTTQGVMVGDYISTSFLAGQQRVVGAFAIGRAPSPDGLARMASIPSALRHRNRE
jgi:hypothetical protein